MSESPTQVPAPKENVAVILLAGVAAMLLGAALWCLVTVVTKSKLGLMAIAVGFLVGFAIQKVRKRRDKKLGILGGALALLGCVVGNAASLVFFVAQRSGVPLDQAFFDIDFSALTTLMVANFDPMDLLFYAIAIYEGYKFSSR